MSERYKKIYHLRHRRYAAGAPVLIESGALLLDQPSNAMLCQLSIRNIQARPIKSIHAVVQALDAQGKPLGKMVDRRFQDLDLKQDACYGRDTAIVLPGEDACAFTVRLRQISFADGEVWTDEGLSWVELPDQPQLEDFCDSPGQAERFRKRFGPDCLGPLETEDLWFCPCGAVNAAADARCHRCRSRRALLLGRNVELRENEEELPESEDSDEAVNSRKARWVWIGAAALAVLSLAAVIVVPRLKSAPGTAAAEHATPTAAAFEEAADPRQAVYEEALGLMEAGNYLDAEESFLSLGDYEDSADLAAQCREKLDAQTLAQQQEDYAAAAALLEAGCYTQARDAFLALGDYEDSAEMAREALYRKAMALYDFVSTHDVRGVTAELTAETDGESRIYLPRERALVLGEDGLAELEAAFGGDAVLLLSAEEGTDGLLPIEEALAAQFQSLGNYRDSAEHAMRLPEMRDRSGEFFDLCAEGRLEEARDWLMAYDKPFDDKELWLQRINQLLPYCGSWSLYSGDPTLVPMIAEDPSQIYSIQTTVVLGQDGAVLRFLLHEGDETGPELKADLDSTQFLLHTDRYSYLAEISPGSGHFSVIKLNDKGVQGGAEYAPKN